MATLQEKLNVLDIYRGLQRLPLGRQVFTRLFQRVAPYFRTIPARVDEVAPGTARVAMRDTRRVRNHLGTVHAIALCNLAEMTMGLVAEATVPRSHRWIPRAMRVEYLAKARGTMVAEAGLTLPEPLADQQDVTVPVIVRNTDGDEVFTADIDIYVTRRRAD